MARDLGRRSKLDTDMIEKLVQLVGAGNYIEVASAACGITEQSYYNWMKKGRELSIRMEELDVDYDEDEDAPESAGAELWESLTQHEQLCVQFFESMKKANAEAEAYAVATVRKAMPNQWQAAMTWLERRYPGRWKRRDETTVRSPFDPAPPGEQGLDEQALLADPEAVAKIHEALTMVQQQAQLPAGEVVEAHVVEAEVVDVED